MTTATCWVHLALFSLCCYHELQPAAFGPSWMSKQFPCDVTHNADDITFDCRRRQLKRIPDGITSNATKLYLGKNRIQNISHDAFSNLGNLTLLGLSWVNNGKRLKHWDKDAFRNLTNLHKLQLTGTGLQEVPRYLPPNLETLDLESNAILFLNNVSLSGMPNVKKLYMSKNCYYFNPCGKPMTIVNDSFLALAKLQVLTLAFNNLTCVPKGLPSSLETLHLGFNRIRSIDKDDFHNLTDLKVLRLQGNCPRCENAPYPCEPCHPKPFLDIHHRAFANLGQLNTLHLAGNSLRTLETSWFEGLSNLKDLFLSFNLLIPAIDAMGEAGFLSCLPKLERLDLSFNYGIKVYPETIKLSKHFSKLVSLKSLHLMGLVFKEITQETLSPLCELKNLSALILGTNFIVRSNSTIFSNFSHLKMIYLAENRLYPVSVNNPPMSNEGHNLKSVPTPFLAGRHRQDFAYELSHGLTSEECFHAGRVLILSSNNIFFISPEQFVGYGDIACLNLSRNGFSAALNGTEFTYLPNLTYLDLSFNKIDLAYDNAFKELKKLEVLDLSYNPHYFQAYGVTQNLNFLKNLPALRVLNMSHNGISVLTTKKMYSKSLSELQFQDNYLGTLWKKSDRLYSEIFLNLINLTILDISFNYITMMPKHVYRHLPHNLTKLVISHNSLKEFNWNHLGSFSQLQILDLSYNSLSCVAGNISTFTHTLRLLDLSYNRIVQLSDGFLKGTKSLETLYLNNNILTIINQSTFLSGPENYMKTLFLHDNPFKCTCDLLEFILWMEASNVTIPRLTTDVTCSMPANTRGKAVILFEINQCVNDKKAFSLYILSSTFILIVMITATAADTFYWDASYVLQYLRAKLKGYHSLNSSDCAYDAFVTYDTTDPQVSEWVTEHLRAQLEEEGGEKHLSLCLEARDWALGAPLVDNLTQSIQCSRKTLFVLTEAYVKTGAFRLAIYLAHQRLLDENVDVIVLLMLEPVLQNSHFLRLRRRLCGKSVVEWPRTPAAEPWFWQNLRNVVRVDNQVMYSNSYSRYFTSRGYSSYFTRQQGNVQQELL